VKTLALLGTTLGFAFAAGLNLYATVLVVGGTIRLGWITLPSHLSSLAVLADPTVLIVAGVLYAVEFMADKIPAVDHVWDGLHTVVRPLGAAWIAWRTIGGSGLPEPVEVAFLLAAGGVAFSTHAGKAGTRLATASVGGHFFGFGVVLSLLEDAIAFVLAPLSLLMPILVLVIVVVGLIFAFFMAHAAWRILRRRREARESAAAT